jgi:putative transposase
VIDRLRREQPQVSVRALCRLLSVNRSAYLRHHQRTSEPPDTQLREAIERLVLALPGYGYRRVTRQLRREGWHVNHKRVLRLMRAEGLLCRKKRRFVATTDSAHSLPTYPNLLKERVLSTPDEAWVADLTYVALGSGFCYLAVVLDAFSRRVVGWELSRSLETSLTLTALERALETRHPPAGLIHHSDRGVQYASAAYVDRLRRAGAQISMSRRGNPYDNAKAESFMKTLKVEEVYLKQYENFAEAQANIGRFIEDVYNQKRLHSALGYLPRLSSRRFTSGKWQRRAGVDFAAGIHSGGQSSPQEDFLDYLNEEVSRTCSDAAIRKALADVVLYEQYPTLVVAQVA